MVNSNKIIMWGSLIKLLKSPLFLIILSGMIIRILFLVFFAEIYLGRENIYVDGDTYAWCYAFQNLFETGTYTVNPGLEYGYFGRMPGYSFFVGIFYLLCGQDWESAFPFIAWTQLILDCISIYLIYRILNKVSAKRNAALIGASLYATYPFVIVWIPLVYSELSAVFFLLLAINFLLEVKPAKLFFGAAFLGISALLRPQMMLFAVLIFTYVIFRLRGRYIIYLKKSILLGCGFLLIYAPWPIRNYVNHDKIIFTQNYLGFYNWNIDVLGFWSYIYSIKAEWEPQYSQIIHNKKVEFPDVAFVSKEDSLKLMRVINLCQNCGSGFSHKYGYWKEPFDYPNCNSEITRLFNELRESQIKNNPLNFYIKVPLANLKKAFFKSQLTDSASVVRRAASLLFYYRTFLLLCGIAGIFVIIRRKHPGYAFYSIIVLFMAILYIYLCAGTSPTLRNIEIRYFLPADVLMLLPAAYVFSLTRVKRINKALTKKGIIGIL